MGAWSSAGGVLDSPSIADRGGRERAIAAGVQPLRSLARGDEATMKAALRSAAEAGLAAEAQA